MAQLSRPYQIGLAAVAVLAAVWIVALRGHSSSSSNPPSAPTATTTVPAHAPSAPSTSHTSTGPQAPGVEGLSRAINKAHEAAGTSERTNSQLQKKSEEASSPSTSSPSSSATTVQPPAHTTTSHAATTTPAAKAHTRAPAKNHKTTTRHTTTRHAGTTHAVTPVAPSTAKTKTSTKTVAPATAKPAPSPNAGSRSSVPARQLQTEAALKKGDVAVLLFWDPSGSDDQAVRQAVRSIRGGKLFKSLSPASQVADYGSITRGIQIYGTPTVLIVNDKGQTITLTGLQDAYAVRQAIAEARHA